MDKNPLPGSEKIDVKIRRLQWGVRLRKCDSSSKSNITKNYEKKDCPMETGTQVQPAPIKEVSSKEKTRQDNNRTVVNPTKKYDKKDCRMETRTQVPPAPINEASSKDKTRYFIAMFAKPSTRKRKIWEEDGYITISGLKVNLKDEEGKVIQSNAELKLTSEMLTESKPFHLGSKEVILVEELSKNPFGESEKLKESHIQSVNVMDEENENNSDAEAVELPLSLWQQQDSLYRSLTASGGHRNDPPERYPKPKKSKSQLKTQNLKDDDNETPEMEIGTSNVETKYSVLFAKASSKKHKIWEGDGVILVSGSKVILKDDTGKIIQTCKIKLSEEMLSESKIFKMGNKEVQIQDKISGPDPFLGDRWEEEEL